VFFREMSLLDPELVWISPHAPAPASSWKIPLLLKIVQKSFWKRATIAGADSERLSFLFDKQAPVDRSLPFEQREWSGFQTVRGGNARKRPQPIEFTPDITNLRREEPLFDLLIHPGANAKNRSWPWGHYAEVVQSLPLQYKIAAVGLPEDIAAMKKALPADRNISFLTGSLRDSIVAIARCRVLLTMDSGNVHFARSLRVPAVALFGKSDPVNVIPMDGCVSAIYQKLVPCQPCGQTFCSQPEVYCMNLLSPKLISTTIMQRWNESFHR
jgi:heptosyltransferase II